MAKLQENYLDRRAKIQLEKMKIDAENLRADVRDAYVFLRAAINLAIGVFIASSVSFFVIMSQYVAWRVYNSMEMERLLIALGGFSTSVFFVWAISRTREAYKISRNHYLYPARKELGVTESPGGVDAVLREWKRTRLEKSVFDSFIAVNVLYSCVWLWVMLWLHRETLAIIWKGVCKC